MRVIKYDINHLDFFDFGLKMDLKTLKENTCFFDEAFTLLKDFTPIMALGMTKVNNNTAQCWLIKTKHIEQNRIIAIKEVENLLVRYTKKYNVKRWQTIIEEEYVRWIEFMKFERESEMKMFKEKTTYLYRRLM